MPHPETTPPSFPRPRLVLSRCLELDACRYNGASIRAPLVRLLEPHVELLPICPEVEVGLGVPRDPIRLVRHGAGTALIQPATGRDITDTMDAFSARFLDRLPEVEGFLLKARSPSCGIHGVKVFADEVTEIPAGRGTGRFAAAVLARFPDHPIEHERRLTNQRLLDEFLTRLFTLADLRRAQHDDATVADLEAQHVRHHLTRITMPLQDRNALGWIVHEAGRNQYPHAREAWSAYVAAFRRALARTVLSAGHMKAIQRLTGHLEARLDPGERQTMAHLVEEFRAGRLARVALLKSIRGWVLQLGLDRVAQQAYLNPYPAELVQAAAIV